jgi:glycerate-2-kinase
LASVCVYTGNVKIKNFEELSITPLRRDALKIMESGLRAIDTRALIAELLVLEADRICIKDEVCSTANVENIYFVGVGKCAHEASIEVEAILGSQLKGGIVLDVAVPDSCTSTKIKCFSGTHPSPSDMNIEATREIIGLLKRATERDLVLFVVSGGASTLLCLPEEGYSCLDEELILKALFKSGADITEVNTIRKHMSLARGGYLAKYAYPAQVMALIFSDVPGNDLQFVASAPTVMDRTTISDADNILAKYGILQQCDLLHCGLIETPKEEKYFEMVRNILLVTNETALSTMRVEAEKLGYGVELYYNAMTGEARRLGGDIVSRLNTAGPKSVLLYGGETTVTITGKGKGGRNKELCMSSLLTIGDNMVLLSVNSDGHDNGENAGAIVDMGTKKLADMNGLNINSFLNDNNSEGFFAKIGGLVETGTTGSNVSDLVVGIKS